MLGSARRVRPTATAAPGLRWTIDTAATAGRWGDAWGDTHFASSLAAALRRLGQQVTVDRKPGRQRESRRDEDVILVLRGLDRVEPVPGPLNLLWVISHPDEVTADEASDYDAVFAASPGWAAARSAQWGVVVRPLLQATDAALFHPGRSGGRPSDVLFVGNARRGHRRPVVEAALEAGIAVDLYGTGWEEIAASRVVAGSVPNADVGALYAAAGIVLNDHWDDMRVNGFVSNRLFDAVATGARVVSDPVEGAAELFGDCVRFADTPADVERLLSAAGGWPDRRGRLEVAGRIRAEHSFDQRARVLLDCVLAERGEAPAQPPSPAGT